MKRGMAAPRSSDEFDDNVGSLTRQNYWREGHMIIRQRRKKYVPKKIDIGKRVEIQRRGTI